MEMFVWICIMSWNCIASEFTFCMAKESALGAARGSLDTLGSISISFSNLEDSIIESILQTFRSSASITQLLKPPSS